MTAEHHLGAVNALVAAAIRLRAIQGKKPIVSHCWQSRARVDEFRVRPRFLVAKVFVGTLALLAALSVTAAPGASAQTAAGPVTIGPNHDFGEVNVGEQSGIFVFMATNTGSEPVTIQSVSLAGASPGQFEIVDEFCIGETLQPGESCEVWVRFVPTAGGAMRAELGAATTAGPANPATLEGAGREFLEPPDDVEAPRYDLFARSFLATPDGDFLRTAMAMGIGGHVVAELWRGELAVPLVRKSTPDDPFGVEVARAPDSVLGIDLMRQLGIDVVVRSAAASERESLPTTIRLATQAPLRLTELSLGDRPFFWAEGEDCRVIDDGFPEDSSRTTLRGECDVDPINPGDARLARAAWEWDRLSVLNHGARYRYVWSLECRPPLEWDCAFNNHTVTGSFVLSFPPRSTASAVRPRAFRGQARGPAVERGKVDRAEGQWAPQPTGSGPAGRAATRRGAAITRSRPRTVSRADRPTRVEVALVRLAKGQRGFTGASAAIPPDPAEVEAHSGRRCSWLADRNRTFRRTPAAGTSVCDKPVWLRTNLRTPGKRARPSRWRFRLRRDLRPGRYVLYSRTTTRRGMPELVFNERRGNRVAFRITKRGKVRGGPRRR